MAKVFNAGEIFEIGIQIEKNGHDFYAAAAAGTEDESLKKLFTELADWEGQHIKLFQELRDKLPEGAKQEIEFDPDDVVYLYLKSLADSMVFNSKNTGVEGLLTTDDILNKAIEMEKESIVVYSSMKEVVPVSMGKAQIDRLISEEIGHVGHLIRRKNK